MAEKIIQTKEQAEALMGDIHNYDIIVVGFSGGKDSVALVLHLLELGVPKSKIELWHHDIDGEGKEFFMDWAATKSYCKAFAKAMGLKLYFSWRDGGFKREMLRNGKYVASKDIPDLLISANKREFIARHKTVKKEYNPENIGREVKFTLQEVEVEPIYKVDKETGDIVLDEEGHPVIEKLEKVKGGAKIGEEFTLEVDRKAFTGDTYYENENHEIKVAKSMFSLKSIGRRYLFPQVTADLSTRWCSAYLKIDVCATAIRNQERFIGKKTLLLTGERGEESSARGKYNIFEVDRSDNRGGRKSRHVDHFRPIRDWTEQEVWAIFERWNIRPHIAYEMGYGRVSCLVCIFGNADQMASSFLIAPEQVTEIMELEELFGKTIKRKKSMRQLVEEGTPYDFTQEQIEVARNCEEYPYEIIMPEGTWVLPKGAYGESCGPI